MQMKRKWTLLTLGVFCMATTLIGFSYAEQKVQSSIENNLYTPTVQASVDEKFNQEEAIVTWPGSVDKEVAFSNNGTAPVFVRIAYTEFWKLEGNIFLPNLVDGVELADKVWTTAFNLNDPNTCEWIDGQDGWYYYKKVLSPSEVTNTILTKVEFASRPLDTRYEKAKYHLEFRVEVVQASKDNVVNQQATSSLFKKTATVGEEGVVTWS